MIDKVVLCIFLIRATITDMMRRRIENSLILAIFLGKIVITICDYYYSYEKALDINSISVQLIVVIMLLLFYAFNQSNIGAGDIKLLLASQLYFSSKEVIPWFVFVIIPIVISCFLFGIQRRLPLAPFILFSTLIVWVIDYI